MSDDADLGIELMVVSGRFARMATQLSSEGIPRAMWRMLAQLAERGPMRVTELARIDRIAQPTATALVRKLKDAGHVVTAPDPADARASLVSLSDRGRERLAELRAGIGQSLASELDKLTDADKRTLREALAIMRRMS